MKSAVKRNRDIVINRDLAKEIGLEESIILQEIVYMECYNEKKLVNILDFMSPNKIKQIVIDLKNRGLFEQVESKVKNEKEINSHFEKYKKYIEDSYFNELYLAYPYDEKLIEEIKLIILDMYFSESIKIQGQEKCSDLVRNALNKLDFFKLESLIAKYKKISKTTEIRNTKSYLQTMIYNHSLEDNLQIQNSITYNYGY